MIVGSYTDVAPVVASIAKEVAARIMVSPTLGDFIDLRFVEIGAFPGQPKDYSAVAWRIANQLILPSNGAGRNYFGLVIIGRSAVVVERILIECNANAVIEALPIRSFGIANVDDRGSASSFADRSTSSPTMAVSEAGAWAGGELIDELRCYAEQLYYNFATGRQAGLTRDQLNQLRLGNLDELIAGESGSPGEELTVELDSSSLTTPDVLSPQRESPSESARPLAAETATGGNPKSPTSGLAFLILSSNEGSEDQITWRRGRSVLIEVDKQLAATPDVAYQVRAIQSVDDTTKSNLQLAGRLSRHDIRWSAEGWDFPRALSIVRAVMKRDLSALELSGMRVKKAALIFFAADPPLADAITAEVYDELTKEASVVWVVPERSAELMAPLFSNSASIIIDHKGIADEVVNLLTPKPQEALG